MAICSHINATGQVETNTTLPDSCTDMILLEPNEWLFFSELQQQFDQAISMRDIFAIPEVAELQTAFMTGFSLIMIAYLVSWGYGVVINWFTPKHDEY
jgi:hypothetical protein